MRGIADYARQHADWILDFNPESQDLRVCDLQGWRGDGVLSVLRTKGEVESARTFGLPVVNLSGALRHPGFPRVMVDQEAVGRLGAEHLLACGFRRFAFFGLSNKWYSELRKRGFLERLAAESCEYSVLELPTSFNRRNPWYRWLEAVEQWLRSLKPPVGLMAARDYPAAVVVETCLRIGLRVPDDVAVLGVGNEPFTCEFCAVPLSSVARSTWQVGYSAAALLDNLMAGKNFAEQELLIAPEGVVQRGSTDVLRVDCPPLASALAYIRENSTQPLRIASILKHVPISRRLLEILFRKHIGLTPRQFVEKMRLDRSKQMMADCPTLKMQRIARACGFTSARHFRDVFRRSTGLAPSRYRELVAQGHSPFPSRRVRRRRKTGSADSQPSYTVSQATRSQQEAEGREAFSE